MFLWSSAGLTAPLQWAGSLLLTGLTFHTVLRGLCGAEGTRGDEGMRNGERAGQGRAWDWHCFSTICLFGLEFLSLTMSTRVCPHDTAVRNSWGNGQGLSMFHLSSHKPFLPSQTCRCTSECKDVKIPGRERERTAKPGIWHREVYIEKKKTFPLMLSWRLQKHREQTVYNLKQKIASKNSCITQLYLV